MDAQDSDATVVVESMRSPERFALIFDRYADVLHRYFARRTGLGDADDLVSELFIVAFERRARFAPEATSALPWLYGIAAHLLHRRTRLVASTKRLTAHAERVTDVVVGPHDDAVAARVDDAAELQVVTSLLAS